MLTSGSTGAPKCVMLTHANLLAMTAGVQIMNGFSEHDVTLNWMAMDHVAGIVMSHVRDVFLGCRQVHAPTDLVLQTADAVARLDRSIPRDDHLRAELRVRARQQVRRRGCCRLMGSVVGAQHSERR